MLISNRYILRSVKVSENDDIDIHWESFLSNADSIHWTDSVRKRSPNGDYRDSLIKTESLELVHPSAIHDAYSDRFEDFEILDGFLLSSLMLEDDLIYKDVDNYTLFNIRWGIGNRLRRNNTYGAVYDEDDLKFDAMEVKYYKSRIRHALSIGYLKKLKAKIKKK